MVGLKTSGRIHEVKQMIRALFALGIVGYFLLSMNIVIASESPTTLSTSEFLNKFTPKISEKMRLSLAETNNSFTYIGEPIHPGLIKEFSYWISDSRPVTLAVDISSAYKSNEYFDKVEELDAPGGLYHCFTADIGEGTKNRFCYTHRHKTEDGDHYIEAFTNDLDSDRIYQTFKYDFIVRFDLWHGVDSEGEIYEQLVMRLIGYR